MGRKTFTYINTSNSDPLTEEELIIKNNAMNILYEAVQELKNSLHEEEKE